MMLLTAVRTGSHPCFDRIVFDFQSKSEPRVGYSIRYRSPPFYSDPKGERVEVAGNAFLVVRLEPASGVDLTQPNAPQTYKGPTTIDPKGLAYVVELKETGDFESVMTWVIGLRERRSFTATTQSVLPGFGQTTRSEQLVIDVG